MSTAEAKATALTKSYAEAMALSLSATWDTTACAEALVSHYAPHFTSFVFGAPPQTMQDAYPGGAEATAGQDPREVQAKVVHAHLKRFEKAGFGVKMKGFEVKPYSAGSG